MKQWNIKADTEDENGTNSLIDILKNIKNQQRGIYY